MKKTWLVFFILLISYPCHAGSLLIGSGQSESAGVGDVTAPEFSSASIAADGETTTINFNENVTGTENDTFTLDCVIAGDPVALTYASGSGTSALVFTAGDTLVSTGAGESCTLDFNGDANDFEDDAGNDLVDFDTEAVTNNSTQGVSCAGTADFIWECDNVDVTVSGCSSGDDSATANSDATISAGAVVLNDTVSSNGADHYVFDVSSDDIVDDTIGTVFIRFKIDTFVDDTRLFVVLQDADNEIYLRLDGTDEFRVKHEGAAAARIATTTDANVSTGTEYIARFRWRTGATDPSLTINIYNTSLEEQGSGALSTDDLSAFSVQAGAGDFYVGQDSSAYQDYNISIYYIHVYSEWLDTDPNI